jgi:hypothetical protein
VDGSLVRKSLRVLPAIEPPGAFQNMGHSAYMRSVTSVVTLATPVLGRGREKTTASMLVPPRVIAQPRPYKEV